MEWLLAYTLSRTSKVPQRPSLVVLREGEYLKLFSDMGVISDLEKLRIASKLDLTDRDGFTSTGMTEWTKHPSALNPIRLVQNQTSKILRIRLLA